MQVLVHTTMQDTLVRSSLKLLSINENMMCFDNFLIKCLTTTFYAKEANGWMDRRLVIGSL